MAIQNNGNEDENASDATLAAEIESEVSGANGQSKRRGRAARRRRRVEAEAAVVQAVQETTDLEDVSLKKDAPTRGRRQKERTNFLARLTRPVTTYLQETVAELRKVTWPTREESLRLSGIVLAVTGVSAIALGFYNALLDAGLGFLLDLLTP